MIADIQCYQSDYGVIELKGAVLGKFQHLRLRKDGQPDMRYGKSKEFQAAVDKLVEQQRREYEAGV